MSDSKSKAISIIRAEHRALGAVINNIRALLQEVQAERMTMDFKLFWAMVYYIDAFPDRLHHPKEDDWLFARLSARTPLADSLIKTLQSGSAHSQPAATIRTPARIAVTDPSRSPITCSHAPRIFRSCLWPE